MSLVLDADFKGYPTHLPPLPLEQAGRQGWQVLRGDLPLPLAVLKDDAIRHNLDWMQRFCVERGLDIAPHGKTSMSPELYHRQMAAGAWGISFATVFQAAVGARHGIGRVVIANQVLQWADLDGLAALHRDHPALQSCFLVDSVEQVDQIEAWARARPGAPVWRVLLELGVRGKRTGVRDDAQARALARRVRASPALQLIGIECYEGVLSAGGAASEQAGAQALMSRLRSLVEHCVAEDLFETDEVILSAGGSAIFDLVAEHLRPALDRPARGVLRSGCYITHDHVAYREQLERVASRLQQAETLRPALEVLSCVQSCPEPGLALLSMGKRDVSHDLHMPVPVWRAQVGASTVNAVPAHWRITALNDQHAFLRFDADAAPTEHPRLGEIVGSGVSHPCTTFDKWRWMPVVDEGYRVVDAVSIHF
jgi:D-serine dehydratase